MERDKIHTLIVQHFFLILQAVFWSGCTYEHLCHREKKFIHNPALSE